MILTALAAVLAFIPLTTSAFWGPMAFTLIGGTAVGTILVLAFLPALYALWFRVQPAVGGGGRVGAVSRRSKSSSAMAGGGTAAAGACSSAISHSPIE